MNREERGPPARPFRGDVTWIIGTTALFVVVGMAYVLWWPAVVRHHSYYWIVPGDFWYSVRTAHWIGWGSLSYVYSNYRSALVTLPGFEVIFTPFVMLSSALHLSEVAPGLAGPAKPTAWLLLGPLALLCVAVPLSASNGLARRLGFSSARRRLLVLAEAAALWPAVAIWGHPEDLLALGLAVFALTKLVDRKWTAAGWLLGAALTMQLLVVMLVPILIALVGWRRIAPVLLRAAILPGFLAVVVLVPDFHAAMWVLANQPSDPTVNHLTPWFALGATVGPRPVGVGRRRAAPERGRRRPRCIRGAPLAAGSVARGLAREFRPRRTKRVRGRHGSLLRDTRARSRPSGCEQLPSPLRRNRHGGRRADRRGLQPPRAMGVLARGHRPHGAHSRIRVAEWIPPRASERAPSRFRRSGRLDGTRGWRTLTEQGAPANGSLTPTRSEK